MHPCQRDGIIVLHINADALLRRRAALALLDMEVRTRPPAEQAPGRRAEQPPKPSQEARAVSWVLRSDRHNWLALSGSAGNQHVHASMSEDA